MRIEDVVDIVNEINDTEPAFACTVTVDCVPTVASSSSAIGRGSVLVIRGECDGTARTELFMKMIRGIQQMGASILWSGNVNDPIYVPVEMFDDECFTITPTAVDVRRITRLVDQAFRALQLEGIQGFAGWFSEDAIDRCDAESRARLNDSDTTGFVCYTMEDADQLDVAGTLHLRFGSLTSNSETELLTVGQHVAAAMEKVGLTVCWDGDTESLIAVYLLETQYSQ